MPQESEAQEPVRGQPIGFISENILYVGERKPRSILLLQTWNGSRYCSLILFEQPGSTAEQYREEIANAIATINPAVDYSDWRKDFAWLLMQHIDLPAVQQYKNWQPLGNAASSQD